MSAALDHATAIDTPRLLGGYERDRNVPVRAEVVDVPMFSVHADAAEIVAWLAQAPEQPQVCYVVHGEPDAAEALRNRIHQQLGWTAVVPSLGERVRLD